MKFSKIQMMLALAGIVVSLQAQNVPEGRKDIMDRAYITPARVVWHSGEVENLDVLLRKGNGQADVAPTARCYMSTHPGDTASVILDFGKELCGGLKLTLGGSRVRKVRIRLGESVSETCAPSCDTAWIAGHSTNDHAMRDFELTLPRMGSLEIGESGFRFVRIDLLESGESLDIKEISAVLRWRDIPYEGAFKCSDERLNQIWQTGAYTVHLNMQDYIWDGIKRDRLVWLGDLHPEMSTVAAVFGYNDVIDRSIDLACEQFPLPMYLNGMCAYSMWYLIIHWDWYMHNGGKAFVEKHRDYICGLVDLFDSKIARDGTLDLGDRPFLDWPSSPNEAGVSAGCRALLSIALDDASKLCNLLGESAYADKALKARERLLRTFEGHNSLKQAAALMGLAGIIPVEKACEDVVAVGGAKGFSTFYGYYMLEALAAAGRYDEALQIISDFWGGMLDLGATTFWEDFDLEWARNAGRIDEFTPEGKDDIHGDFGAYCYKSFRHSLCHGWASGPTAWMSNHVLGVEILEPGCRKVRITPHLGSLDWAEGLYPTPYGAISIRHEKMYDGRVVSTVSAPEGVQVVE